jgi:hypothetical protein
VAELGHHRRPVRGHFGSGLRRPRARDTCAPAAGAPGSRWSSSASQP